MLGQAVAVDKSRNVLVSGSVDGANGEPDIMTVKFNADGNLLWASRYDGPFSQFDTANSIALDRQGNVSGTDRRYRRTSPRISVRGVRSLGLGGWGLFGAIARLASTGWECFLGADDRSGWRGLCAAVFFDSRCVSVAPWCFVFGRTFTALSLQLGDASSEGQSEAM